VSMHTLYLLIDLVTSAALLVPIGVLGMFRWAMWLAKRIPALFYRPITNDYTCTATIVTPVYNEDPALFRRAIESWLANAPDRIIAVIDVTDTRCMAIAAEYPELDVIPIDIPGKRPALAAGVDASTTDIVVLVDRRRRVGVARSAAFRGARPPIALGCSRVCARRS
jgi:cellulose synthase/poly-beta-1,6-N-acetylglucosamine synthase-like glycosyltransferase